MAMCRILLEVIVTATFTNSQQVAAATIPGAERFLGTAGRYAGTMARARWLDDTEMQAWRGLLEVSTRLLNRLDDELAAHGISLAEYEVLAQLSGEPSQAMRMTELADRALVSRSGLTRRVDGLERRGLVRRESCPSDRRGSLAVLTDAGRELLEQLAPTHVDGVRRHFLDRLTPEQIAALAEALNAVAAPGDEHCDMSSLTVAGRAQATRH
jgi:DNA-binding MarR family transcriptional regulator